jgi:hypothetical protein
VVEAGAVRVVGTDRTTIVESAVQLLTDEDAYRRMAEAVNPYGDGYAARRIVHHILPGITPLSWRIEDPGAFPRLDLPESSTVGGDGFGRSDPRSS